VLKELAYPREELIITTKLFWGTRPGPNNAGLSRKQYVVFQSL
jgi:aryl-alcohol dehydrogenase-like predicted oxidoreductase